jgi:1-acyl-sn-glycerol-3-phosphate acyltransferase
MNRVDVAWKIGHLTIGAVTRAFVPLRVYGKERVPPDGGVVMAFNHFSWIDPPAFGEASPRTIYYMAKAEAHRIPGLGQLIRAFGTFSVRRGESDREAVRMMRDVVRRGHALGLFVEGTRQRSGLPGKVQPGAAMAALQEDVPIIPAAIYGTHEWRPGNWKPVSIVWGEPMRFDGLPKSGKGYREASAEVERELHRLWRWLGELHQAGRPAAVPELP